VSQQIRQAIWDKFLARWPIEKLHEMTLTEYTQLKKPKNEECFSRCIKYYNDEFGKARGSGGWYDGTEVFALPPGINPYKDRHYDEVKGFGWKPALGKTLEDAFRALIAHVAAIANDARQGKFDLLKHKTLNDKFAWKLAFIYQDRSNLKLLPVQDIALLTTIRRKFMNPPINSIIKINDAMEANVALMSIRAGKPIFEYVDELQAALAIDDYEDEAVDPGVAQAVGTSPEDVEMTVTAPLNVVLYGPPGTGKTYGTIDEALSILDPDLVLKTMSNAHSSHEARREHRRLRKAGFDALVKAQRVRFVTFHQSFSYEDFVEGLRAVEEDTSETGITYRVEPGVFKQICTDAQRNAQVDAGLGVRDGARLWKLSIDGTGSSSTREYCLTHDEARIGWGSLGDLTVAQLSQPQHGLGSNDQNTLSGFATEVQEGDVVLCIRSATSVGAVGVVKPGGYRYDAAAKAGVQEDYRHVLPVRWLSKNLNFDIRPLNGGKVFTQKTLYPLHRLNWPQLADELQKTGVSFLSGPAYQAPQLPYVLIIDEINRGNVSRIFGELITLIEPSKRAGATEALSVTLPYSKQPFSVPGNVHLIGTMNTADRSLSGLDIALRRRFVFKEKPPQPELLGGVFIEGLNVGEMLAVMNQRIEVLLDRDHLLGHAYFMALAEEGANTLAHLSGIFRHQVLPLLQEYFFEDWERICWVLNDHRKKVDAHCFVIQRGAPLEVLFGAEQAGKLRERRWQLNEPAFGLIDSYRGILSPIPA